MLVLEERVARSSLAPYVRVSPNILQYYRKRLPKLLEKIMDLMVGKSRFVELYIYIYIC
jgi:hypothetical protein